MRTTGQLRLALMTSVFITASLCAAPSFAQQAETEQASSIDDIVVTARRREESRPCKNVLSCGGAGVATRRRAPSPQALIASISGFVPSTAITRFML